MLEKIMNEIKYRAVEFELFGISSDYVNVGIVEDIIRSHMEDNGWIPVEERLPEETIETFDGVFSSEPVIVTTINENGELLRACDFLIGKQWVCTAGNEKVIAWRPLPEPYQPKE